MIPFERHLFVCLNDRGDDPRGSCLPKGAEQIHARLKELLKSRGLAGRVRANRAGCLDACAHGVTMVVYPDGVWYGGLKPADVEEIVDSHVVNGIPVERLRIEKKNG